MAYKRKTVDCWHIMTNYGEGWGIEDCEYSRKEAFARAREYKENTTARVKTEKHREPINDINRIYCK